MANDKSSNCRHRKKYQKPQVTSERVFETNALACGKCQNVNQLSFGAACARGRPISS